VAVFAAHAEPPREQLRAAWKQRRGQRGNPLLVVALHEGRAHIAGPDGEPPRHYVLPAGQAQRIASRALDAPDRNAALRYLKDTLPYAEVDNELPGFRNEGLLTDHVLRAASADAAAMARGRAVLGARDGELLRRLGFAAEKSDQLTSLLRAGNERTAIAVLLLADEIEELPTARFQQVSPIQYALNRADHEDVPWVITVQADRVRLYPRRLDVGVGRRGRTDTFIEVRTDLLLDDQAALLWLAFSADALATGGSMGRLLDQSRDFAASLAARLRERIYDEVVPRLAAAIGAARGIALPTPDDLRRTYAMALKVLFRLLFIAYAEDRDLLPYRRNEAYRKRSLKAFARELHDHSPRPGPGAAIWTEMKALFDAVRAGNPGWGVPEYDGGLFENDVSRSPDGAALDALSIPDAALQPALRALLLERPADLRGADAGPVDFRSLKVAEFGTIYEGLLESELALAETDLALKTERGASVYVPARKGDAVRVPAGATYLHNRSGARKASGSYFTPEFAVQHLLDAALEPALDAHITRLEALVDDAAAEAFFDLRIADIAMGSGHFLVQAIDRVEKRFTAYLVRRPLPGVQAELLALGAQAAATLKDLELDNPPPVEPAQLLRRLIARRCIYGVDLNALAVDLARLSIWIHTFVPGLPLGLLEHTIVHGNALVGIATVRQMEARFAASGIGLFPVDAHTLLGDAAEPLRRLAAINDATADEVRAARNEMAAVAQAVAKTRALCDLVIGDRLDAKYVKFQFERWPELAPSIEDNAALHRARSLLAGLDTFHFPVAFPEVFLRARPGFDVILGNPPWEKVKVEEHGFWARHFPGLRGLPAAEREARLSKLPKQRPDLAKELATEVAHTARERGVLTAGLYPGMGTGDPDLFKAFAWRFWQLAAEPGGAIGVVLPRSAVSGLGTADLRRAMFAGSARVEVSTVTNRAGWVFAEADPRYTIAMLAVVRGVPRADSIALRGPFADRRAWDAARAVPPHRFAAADILGWTSSASVPLLPSEASVGVFAQLRQAPRLDLVQQGAWRARPDTELHSTADKGLMQFKPADTAALWPVFKGESFDIWQPDREAATYYAWAEPEVVLPHLHAKRLRSGRSSRGSAHGEFPLATLQDAATLACHAPRIAFRDVTRATDSRTVRAALLPPQVFVNHKAPYLLWSSGDALDQAFLLGVLCSVPLDWFARRFVEISLTFFVLNPFPIPRPPRTDSRWQRAVALAGRLAAPDDRFATWAAQVGVDHGPLDPATKQAMIEELDAVVAHLYGLDAAQLAHVFDTFHDWPTAKEADAWAARRDRTLAHLAALG
jgi:hypothetical protein